MSIPKLKFLALFFVFFAVFWQITTSFYIKMSPAGRQDFSRAAKGAAGLPRKESLRLFQPQAEGNAFRGTLCQAAPHATKKHKGLRQNFAWRCTNSHRKITRRSYFALPRCVRNKEETGTILSLAWQKRRFARSGLGSEACKPARLRRPAQVCRSDRAQNGVAFGNNTTPACRQDGMTCAACIDGIVIILAARFLRGCYLAGTSFSSLCRTLRLFCSDGICSLFCTACKNTPAYGAGAEARFVYVLVCGLR